MSNLIVFDMDGTLTKTRNSWNTVNTHFGLSKSVDEAYDAWLRGEISEKEWGTNKAIHILARNGPIHKYDILKVLRQKVELVADIKMAVRELHEMDYIVGIVSGGVDLLAYDICENANMDFAIANGYKFNIYGWMQPEYVCRVPYWGKDKIMSRLIQRYNPTGSIIAVGDALVDVPMFEMADFSFGFNPTDVACAHCASMVIKSGSLLDITHEIVKDAFEDWYIGDR